MWNCHQFRCWQNKTSYEVLLTQFCEKCFTKVKLLENCPFASVLCYINVIEKRSEEEKFNGASPTNSSTSSLGHFNGLTQCPTFFRSWLNSWVIRRLLKSGWKLSTNTSLPMKKSSSISIGMNHSFSPFI